MRRAAPGTSRSTPKLSRVLQPQQGDCEPRFDTDRDRPVTMAPTGTATVSRRRPVAWVKTTAWRELPLAVALAVVVALAVAVAVAVAITVVTIPFFTLALLPVHALLAVVVVALAMHFTAFL